MTECHLHREGGRAHFMTKRFDRTAAGDKLHVQSLCALMHYDFNQPAAYSYEQAFEVISRLGLPASDREQQFRRAVFNVVARNQDDHVKNIAFTMDRRGTWRLSPAFDVAYAYNPMGAWTSQHQMSIQGKRDRFTVDDLVGLGARAGLKRGAALKLIIEVVAAIMNWPQYAEQGGVARSAADQIRGVHRLYLADGQAPT